jgi:hypothetical protein
VEWGGGYAPPPPHGIDAAGIARACAGLASQIEADGGAGAISPGPRIRLTRTGT